MKRILKTLGVYAAVTVMMFSPVTVGNVLSPGYHIEASASEENTINYKALDFDSGLQTTIKFSIKPDNVRRFELLYETPGYDNAAPVVNISMGANVYSATYGHVQEKNSPVTVRQGRDITSSDAKKGKLKTAVIYIDGSKADYSGKAELTLSKTGISTLVLATTSVPQNWKNIVNGEEEHMYPEARNFWYFTDPVTSFYKADDLAKIESEGLQDTTGDKLATVAAPKKKPVNNTSNYMTLIAVGGAVAAAFIIYAIFAAKKKAKKNAEVRMQKRKARRAHEVEKIKNSEDISEVLDELDYSDDDTDEVLSSKRTDTIEDSTEASAYASDEHADDIIEDNPIADTERVVEPVINEKVTEAVMDTTAEETPVKPVKTFTELKNETVPERVDDIETSVRPTAQNSESRNISRSDNVIRTIDFEGKKKEHSRGRGFAAPAFLSERTNE